jgi:hypothetical protein
MFSAEGAPACSTYTPPSTAAMEVLAVSAHVVTAMEAPELSEIANVVYRFAGNRAEDHELTKVIEKLARPCPGCGCRVCGCDLRV